jgi:catechol 2,3-dioxygenase-like lactoylglutathione lyase family enzyme
MDASLSHIRLLVSDFDTMFRFYRDVMGFDVTWGEEGSGYADFKAGDGTQLAINQRSVMAAVVRSESLPLAAEPIDRFALIFGVQHVDGAVEHLSGRGATFVTEPADRPEWGIRTAHLRDPEGNLIELNSPLPSSEWTDELRQEAEKYEQA